MELGGIGAALINASLTSLLISLLMINGIKPNGSTIMSLWLMTGFSFLGKNIFNIWPIILGIYYLDIKSNLSNYILVAILGTSLSPIVSQISFGDHLSTPIDFLIGILLGVLVGFILPPIASHSIKAHNGYNLYNIGFASGFLATLLMSILRSFGVNFDQD